MGNDRSMQWLVILQMLISLGSMIQGILEFFNYIHEDDVWIAWVYLLIWEPFGYIGIRVLDAYSQQRAEQMELWFGIQFGWTVIVQIVGAILVIFEPTIRTTTSPEIAAGILVGLTLFWCVLTLWMWTVAARWTASQGDGLISPLERSLQVEMGSAESPPNEVYRV